VEMAAWGWRFAGERHLQGNVWVLDFVCEGV
jgi:hypothetical protein